MKILELDLIAFGPFSGTRLDFSAGEQGLHLVYGPNATGKSSTLRAITGLLYGIPRNTNDDHVHRMQDLRIGARLRSESGDELRFVRRKGTKGTVLDEEGDAIDGDVLAPYLTGVPLQRFLDSIGIDHHRLVQGGRRLLEGRGDAGEVVMEAGLGGSRLRQLREALQRA